MVPKTLVQLNFIDITETVLPLLLPFRMTCCKECVYFLLFWMFAHARSYSSVFACDVGSRYRKLRMLLRCHDIYSISQSGPWRQLKGMPGARGLRVMVYSCIVVVSYVKHIYGFSFGNNKWNELVASCWFGRSTYSHFVCCKLSDVVQLGRIFK